MSNRQNSQKTVHLPKKCNYPCCKAIAEQEKSRCSKHAYKPKQSTTKNAHIYKSFKWQKLRKIYYSNNPLCENCLLHNAVVKGVIVDHVIEINDGGAVYDYNNLRTLCISCHNTTTTEQRQKRNGLSR